MGFGFTGVGPDDDGGVNLGLVSFKYNVITIQNRCISGALEIKSPQELPAGRLLKKQIITKSGGVFFVVYDSSAGLNLTKTKPTSCIIYEAENV